MMHAARISMCLLVGREKGGPVGDGGRERERILYKRRNGA